MPHLFLMSSLVRNVLQSTKKYVMLSNMETTNGINTQKLREYREKLGLTQNALDRAAKVGGKTVRNAEAGNGITVTTLKKIAQALGVHASIFLD